MSEISRMLPLGTSAPAFNLLDPVSGEIKSLDDLKSNIATVIMFLCNHCPYVKHIENGLISFAKKYQQNGIHFIAISSNDVTSYPQDGPQEMAKEAVDKDYPFPYLYDETQDVAKAYHAACTPDFYVFDKNLRCVYRGRFDDSTPGNQQSVTGADLQHALEQILKGEQVSSDQKPSVGCSIKWKK